MAYYIFLKEHECILPTLWLVFTLFAIIIDELPQIVHSWNFVAFLVHLALAILRRYVPVVLANVTCRDSLSLFLYQFVLLVSPSICIPSHFG
jgi:hypothetical protein